MRYCSETRYRPIGRTVEGTRARRQVPGRCGSSGMGGPGVMITVGIEDIVADVARRWRLLLALALASLLIGYGWAKALSPSYRASGAIAVRSVALTAPDSGSNYRDLLGKDVTIASEQEFMGTDAFLEGVAKRLHPTVGDLRSGMLPRLPGSRAAAGRPASLEQTVDWLHGNLAVEAKDGTNLITVGFSSPSRTLSSDVVNTVFDQYIATRARQRADLLANVEGVLRQRIAAADAEARLSDSAALSLLKNPDVLPGVGGQPMVDDVSRLNDVVRTARADSALKQTQYESASRALKEAGGDVSRMTASWDSPLLNQLQDKLATVQQAITQMSATRGPKYPELIALAQQRDELQRSIQAEGNRILAGLRTQSDAARVYQSELQSQLNARGASLQSGRADAVSMQQLRSRVDTLRAASQSMRQELEQIISRGAIPQARIVAPAVPPLKNGAPGAVLIGAVLAFFVTAAAALVIVVRSQLGRGRKSPVEQIGLLVDRPVLGVIPQIPKGERPLIGGRTKPADALHADALTESVRALALKLEDDAAAQGRTVLLVTSALPGEGKSTTTALVGSQLALIGRRVLMVGADLRRPRLDGLLDAGAGRRTEPDLVVDGHAYAIHADEATGACWLNLSTAGEPPHSFFRSRHFAALVEAIRGRFEIVLLDGPPVLNVADSLLLARHADAVLLVAASGRNGYPGLVEAARRLADAKTPLGGIVVTKLREHRDEYYITRGYGLLPDQPAVA